MRSTQGLEEVDVDAGAADVEPEPMRDQKRHQTRTSTTRTVPTYTAFQLLEFRNFSDKYSGCHTNKSRNIHDNHQ